MIKRTVVSFTKKDAIVSWTALIAMLCLSTFQIVILWIVDLQFSLHFIDYKVLGKTNLNIISTTILTTIIIMTLWAIWKVVKIKTKKVFLKNDYWFLLIVLLFFVIFFLAPHKIPLNFLTPILVLFAFVIYKFRF